MLLLLFNNKYGVIQQQTDCLEHNTGEPQWCLFQGLNGKHIPSFSLQIPGATKWPIAIASPGSSSLHWVPVIAFQPASTVLPLHWETGNTPDTYRSTEQCWECWKPKHHWDISPDLTFLTHHCMGAVWKFGGCASTAYVLIFISCTGFYTKGCCWLWLQGWVLPKNWHWAQWVMWWWHLPMFTEKLLVVPPPKETAARALSHSVSQGLSAQC